MAAAAGGRSNRRRPGPRPRWAAAAAAVAAQQALPLRPLRLLALPTALPGGPARPAGPPPPTAADPSPPASCAAGSCGRPRSGWGRVRVGRWRAAVSGSFWQAGRAVCAPACSCGTRRRAWAGAATGRGTRERWRSRGAASVPPTPRRPTRSAARAGSQHHLATRPHTATRWVQGDPELPACSAPAGRGPPPPSCSPWPGLIRTPGAWAPCLEEKKYTRQELKSGAPTCSHPVSRSIWMRMCLCSFKMEFKPNVRYFCACCCG